jgi:ABC-type cobalt transport system substrate-binding protein
MTQQDHSSLMNKAYYDWVSSLWKDPNNKVESLLTPEMMQWAKDASKNS